MCIALTGHNCFSVVNVWGRCRKISCCYKTGYKTPTAYQKYINDSNLIWPDRRIYWDRTAETRAFAQAFYKRHGAMPTSYQAGVNSALRHYFKAVAATNSSETATVLGWMRANVVDDFFAHGGKIRDDGRMVHDMYLMRIKKPEESQSMWDLYEYLDTIPGDQAFRPMADGGCPLVRP